MDGTIIHYKCLLLLYIFIHRTFGNLNVWATQQVIDSIINNRGNANCKNPEYRLPRIPIVSDGTHFQYAHFERINISIPYNVNSVSMRWISSAKHRYTIQLAPNHTTKAIYEPQLNIPKSGRVPNNESDIQLSLLCTEKVSANETIHIVLTIIEEPSRPRSRFRKNNRKVVRISRTVTKECFSKSDQRKFSKYRSKCACNSKSSNRFFCLCFNECFLGSKYSCCMRRCRRRKRFKAKGLRGRMNMKKLKRCRKRGRKGKKNKRKRKRKQRKRRRKDKHRKNRRGKRKRKRKGGKKRYSRDRRLS